MNAQQSPTQRGAWLTEPVPPAKAVTSSRRNQPLYRRKKPSTPIRVPAPITATGRKITVRITAKDYWTAVDSTNDPEAIRIFNSLCRSAVGIAVRKGWFLPGPHTSYEDMWRDTVLVALHEWRKTPKVSFWTILRRRMIDAIRRCTCRGRVVEQQIPVLRKGETLDDIAHSCSGQRRNGKDYDSEAVRESHAVQHYYFWVEFMSLLANVDITARDMLVLEYMGYTWREIGDIVGLKSDAARKRLTRAIEIVNDQIARGCVSLTWVKKPNEFAQWAAKIYQERWAQHLAMEKAYHAKWNGVPYIAEYARVIVASKYRGRDIPPDEWAAIRARLENDENNCPVAPSSDE